MIFKQVDDHPFGVTCWGCWRYQLIAAFHYLTKKTIQCVFQVEDEGKFFWAGYTFYRWKGQVVRVNELELLVQKDQNKIVTFVSGMVGPYFPPDTWLTKKVNQENKMKKLYPDYELKGMG